MKDLFKIIILTAVLFQCTSKEKPKQSDQQLDTSTVQQDIVPIPVPDSISAYRRQLDNLSSELSSGGAGLQIFKENINKDIPERNDKALKEYLSFQESLITSLNEKLPAVADKSIYENSKQDKEVVAYLKELEKNGLSLGSSEGTAYIMCNTDVVASYFLNYLTPSTKEFFIQNAKEINESYSEDAGLSISVMELSKRVIFWEEFLKKYPEHIFIASAKEYYTAYFFCLMMGLDNTPAFDMESHKLGTEFLDTYLYITKTYPDTNLGKLIKEYLKVLEENKYLYNDNVKAFIESKTV
jgi:hypothetical protein